MKKEDIKVGGIYAIKEDKENDYFVVFVAKDVPENERYLVKIGDCMYTSNEMKFFDKNNGCTFDNRAPFSKWLREATQHEKNWLAECQQAGKFVKEPINSENYSLTY